MKRIVLLVILSLCTLVACQKTKSDDGKATANVDSNASNQEMSNKVYFEIDMDAPKYVAMFEQDSIAQNLARIDDEKFGNDIIALDYNRNIYYAGEKIRRFSYTDIGVDSKRDASGELVSINDGPIIYKKKDIYLAQASGSIPLEALLSDEIRIQERPYMLYIPNGDGFFLGYLERINIDDAITLVDKLSESLSFVATEKIDKNAVSFDKVYK